MRRSIGGRFFAVSRRHDWRPGEKSLHARRNDVRSVQAALRGARNQKVVDPAEVERLEDLHVQVLEALHAVESEYGFEPGHVTVADPVLAADRQTIRDEIFGLTALRRSVESLRVALDTAKRRVGVMVNRDGREVPKYPDDVAALDGLIAQYDEARAKLDEART